MFLNALEEGEIVGSVRAYLERGTVYIGRLMVKPDSQNNGIGTRLMQAIEDHFRMADRYELFTFLSFIISGLRSLDNKTSRYRQPNRKHEYESELLHEFKRGLI